MPSELDKDGLEKADKDEKDARDHRLAAILKLEEARKLVEADGKAAGIKFKDWCATNVKWSPESIRKYLPVAQAKDPKKALEDMRAGNKARNKKLRDKKKTEKTKTSTATAALAAPTTAKDVSKMLDAAKPEVAIAGMKKTAENLGLAVVSATDAKKIDQKADAKAFKADDLMVEFNKLKTPDKMKFLRQAAASVGCQVVIPENVGGGAASSAGDPTKVNTAVEDIPAAFKN